MRAPRFPVNITLAERVARISLGVVGIVTAVLLLRTPGVGITVALEILMGLAGLDLMVTGATGHCPLSKRLGHVPTGSKGRTS